MGRLKHIRAGVTVQYPEEALPLMSRYRSRHRLTVRADDTPRWVGCTLCETVCPARCITIVPGEHPDPDVEKYPVRFDIDLGVCVYCGYGVEVCPEDAIRMDTGILDLAAYSREATRLDIHEFMKPELRKPISDCALSFPHECKVTGGGMKGSWEGVRRPEPERVAGLSEGRGAASSDRECPRPPRNHPAAAGPRPHAGLRLAWGSRSR